MRHALITGGASGFGRAVAERLVGAGAAVALVDVDEARAQATARELGEHTLGIGADVRSADDVRSAVDRAVAAFGALDTVVASAGVFHLAPLEEVAEADWDRTLDVNLKGAFLTLQAASPHLRASGRGRAVTIGSDTGKRGFARRAPYVASKFGLIGLTESVAAELAGDGVTVNCVCPVACPTTGMGQEVVRIKVERGGGTPDEVMAAEALPNPIGRNATEADVADAVMFLLSDQASFLTGLALDIDGGAHLGLTIGTD